MPVWLADGSQRQHVADCCVAPLPHRNGDGVLNVVMQPDLLQPQQHGEAAAASAVSQPGALLLGLPEGSAGAAPDMKVAVHLHRAQNLSQVRPGHTMQRVPAGTWRAIAVTAVDTAGCRCCAVIA
jgi:hypothetical protein